MLLKAICPSVTVEVDNIEDGDTDIKVKPPAIIILVVPIKSIILCLFKKYRGKQ